MNWQVDMLEQSMTKLAPMGDRAAARFYEVLFVDYPSLRSLFHGVSMRDQHKKLWSALAFTVEGFRNPEQLSKTLLELGLKHKAYGVCPDDYYAVRVTLLKILKEFLGESWSGQMHLAWSHALYEVSGIMLQGADQTPTTKASTSRENQNNLPT
jgi:methyl-accepting chemotaxis protein